ncbi:MAG: PQQ-binding-like beta-propeller repeat protein [Kofleriaceae bacterium]
MWLVPVALGLLWQTKVDKDQDRCPAIATTDALITLHGSELERYDRKTGALSKVKVSLDAQQKDPYIDAVSGEIVVLDALTTPMFGVDAKTGAQLWKRPLGPGKQPAASADVMPGGDLIVRSEDLAIADGKVVGIERLDPQTGKARWSTQVTLAHSREPLTVVASAQRIYVIGSTRGTNRHLELSIAALDRNGALKWQITDTHERSPGKWHVVGDHLLSIADDTAQVYDAKAGAKQPSWPVSSRMWPRVVGDSLYEALMGDNTIEAVDALTGKQRWKVKLPNRGEIQTHGEWFVVAATADVVVAFDGTTYASYEAKTGAPIATLGVAGMGDGLFDPRATESVPLIYACAKKMLTAIDPSVTTPEHHVTVTGKVHCKKCQKTDVLELRLADATVRITPDVKFTIEVTGAGTYALQVKRTDIDITRNLKRIELTSDRTIKLGTLDADLPIEYPD